MRELVKMTTQFLWKEFDKALLKYKLEHPKLNIVEVNAPSAEEPCIRVRLPNEPEGLFVELEERTIVEPTKCECSNASEYSPGYIPPQDHNISILSVYTGSRNNRIVARFYAREWLKRWRDDPVHHIGSHALLWQLRMILRMTSDVTSGAHARMLHETGRSFGSTGFSIVETALSTRRSGSCFDPLHASDADDEALENSRDMLLWAIYFQNERCVPYWLKNHSHR